MIYHVQYKCRLCGSTITNDIEIKMSDSTQAAQLLYSIIASGVQNHAVIQGHIYPASIMHTCSNGSYGICDITGLELQS